MEPHIHRVHGEADRREQQQASPPHDTLRQWLDTSPAFRELRTTIRDLRSRLVSASALDLRRTEVTQAVEFAAPSNFFEKVLNGAGRTSKRQMALHEIIATGEAFLQESVRANQEIDVQVAALTNDFIRNTFEKSPDLQQLIIELHSVLDLQAQRKEAWRKVDERGTVIGKPLQPQPIIVHGSSPYQGGGFNQSSGMPSMPMYLYPPPLHHEEVSAIHQTMREIYDRGRWEQSKYFRASVSAMGPLEELLKQPLRIGLGAEDAALWLPTQLNLEPLKNAVTAAVSASEVVSKLVSAVEEQAEECIKEIDAAQKTLAAEVTALVIYGDSAKH